MDPIKFYGGPYHGKTRVIEPGLRRYTVRCQDFQSMRIDYYADLSVPPQDLWANHREVTYEIDLWREQRGNAFREQRVAILEGEKNLQQHERYQIEDDMRHFRWKPWREPSILKDFERWFNWCAYRHTGKEYEYLSEEFQRCLH